MGRKKIGRYLSRRITSTECNDTIIGNNILLLNREYKELVHEHLALFIYLGSYLCLGDHEHVPGPDSCERLPSIMGSSLGLHQWAACYQQVENVFLRKIVCATYDTGH